MNHLVPSPGLHKPVTEAHASNSKTQKVDAGGSGVQDQLRLHRELDVSLGYM